MSEKVTCTVGPCERVVYCREMCLGHYWRVQRHGDPQAFVPLRPQSKRPIGDRFWEKVIVGMPHECWPWRAFINDFGYAQFDTSHAHRTSWELAVGPIPDGLQIDHLCHNFDETCNRGVACLHRSCVNPWHLDPRTPLENTRSGRTTAALLAARTHCKNGHEFTPENTRIRKDGSRACRACHAQWQREYMERKRAS